MPSEVMQTEVPIDQATGESYSEHMRQFLKAIDFYSVELRQAYIYSKENREAHYRLISLLCQSWIQLFPKIMNKPDLRDSFKKWMPIVYEPKILLHPKYENLIWLFEIHIRMGFEHLGLTNID